MFLCFAAGTSEWFVLKHKDSWSFAVIFLRIHFSNAKCFLRNNIFSDRCHKSSAALKSPVVHRYCADQILALHYYVASQPHKISIDRSLFSLLHKREEKEFYQSSVNCSNDCFQPIFYRKGNKYWKLGTRNRKMPCSHPLFFWATLCFWFTGSRRVLKLVVDTT